MFCQPIIIQFLFLLQQKMKKDIQLYQNYHRSKAYERQQDQNHKYFKEYIKICKITQLLNSDINQTRQKQFMVKQKIQTLSNKLQDIRDPFRKQKKQGKKTYRRASSEIQKQHVCEVQGCEKKYASYLSLRIHQKLKHADYLQNQVIDNNDDDLNVDF